MAKQKFTIAHDTRFDGQHVEAGSIIELDNDNDSDAAHLNNLLGSGRIVEVEAAHKHLREGSAGKDKPTPAAPKITPPAKPKPEEKPKD